ncbi:hypothetical protein GCM10022419_110960 [Nonomuraea rosea]|uniref:Uncharacterized protein n=1 Tax=Nonomuraea rosea TaxID=638574 RepID=A0ABP6ZFA2_9ACTN
MRAAVMDGVDGGQGEAVRVPVADGTLVTLPVEETSPLLSDVLCTGHHGAVTAGVSRGFGATDVVAERGEEGTAKVRELTGGAAPARAESGARVRPPHRSM